MERSELRGHRNVCPEGAAVALLTQPFISEDGYPIYMVILLINLALWRAYSLDIILPFKKFLTGLPRLISGM